MNNGIRLNNFENGINQTLKSQISISQNDVNIYNDLFDLEFNIIFNQEAILKNVNKTIPGIAFKNVIDRLNLVIINDVDLKAYYFYDKSIFNNDNFIDDLRLQNNKFKKNILTSYLSKFAALNNKANIKRSLFFEIEIYIYDDKLYKLLDFINNNINIDLFTKLKDIVETQINNLIYQYDDVSITQYWLPFITPEKYCYKNGVINNNVIDFYCETINKVYKIQKNALQYSVGLIGPNVDINNKCEEFIDLIFSKYKLQEKFEYYSFYFEDTNNNDYQNDKYNVNSITNFINKIRSYDNKDILFTNQGISLNPNINNSDVNYNKSKSIGYDEINNDLLLYKQNIYTFKNKLISYNKDKHGLIYYNDVDGVNNPTFQKSFNLYRRINNLAIDYNYLIDNIQISNNNNYNQITLYDNETKTDLIYILWSNKDENITLNSHYTRKFYGLNKDKQNITIDLNNKITVSLTTNDGFIIVIEDNILSNSELSFLKNKAKKVITHFRKTIEHLINILPDSYNKEIIETNFYKLLRAIGLEIGEYKFYLEEIKNGFYLNALDKNEEYLQEAKEDLIYKNFGALIDLPKKSKWSYEQYRKMVTAIINVLLSGPNKENISNAIEEFTGYKNEIYELYKEKNNPIFDNLKDLELTFRFAALIKKDLNKYDDANELMDNLIYLLNIIKPAQALFIIYFVLDEWEDNLEFTKNTLEALEVDSTFNFQETKFGLDLSNTFELFVNDDKRNKLLINKEDTEDVIDLQSDKPPYKKLALPIYKVKDEYNIELNVDFAEQYDISIKDIIKTYDAIKFMENYSYLTDENNNIIIDDNNNPISRLQDEMYMLSSNNLSETYMKDVVLSATNETHKIVTQYTKDIYFLNNELAYITTNKDNIKVFLNGVLLNYNSFDYIKYIDNYSNGIEFNTNIINPMSSDEITILYIKVGNYDINSNKIPRDNIHFQSIVRLNEKHSFKPLGFKLLGNSNNLSPENIYKLCSGQLTNTNYIILGTLQDKSTSKLIIDMNKRNQKPFTDDELYYIELMQNNYCIEVEIINQAI